MEHSDEEAALIAVSVAQDLRNTSQTWRLKDILYLCERLGFRIAVRRDLPPKVGAQFVSPARTIEISYALPPEEYLSAIAHELVHGLRGQPRWETLNYYITAAIPRDQFVEQVARHTGELMPSTIRAVSFGEWVQIQRLRADLSVDECCSRAHCARSWWESIEADHWRPVIPDLVISAVALALRLATSEVRAAAR